MLTDIVAGLAFLGFVLGALWVSVLRKRNARPRHAVSAFIGYCILVSFTAGLTQRDLFPFSAWPLVAGYHPRVVTHPRITVIDARGREYTVDARVWEPLSHDELLSWMESRFLELDSISKANVADYLLRKAEAARRRLVRGGKPGTRRLMGPLTAPWFLLHPRIWTPDDFPRDSLVELRLYQETWDVEQWRGPEDVQREAVYRFRRAAS